MSLPQLLPLLIFEEIVMLRPSQPTRIAVHFVVEYFTMEEEEKEKEEEGGRGKEKKKQEADTLLREATWPVHH